MAQDFTSTIAGLKAACTEPVLAPPALIIPLTAPAEALTLSRAESGDPSAQVEVSYHSIEKARTATEFRPDLVDTAICWARNAANVSDAGMYQLASALLFRAGALAGVGFAQSADVDAAEAIALLDQLADAGYEHAGTALVQAIQALADHGIGYGGRVPLNQES